ncbi:SGNH/GDSL hydrolase family protein [Rufibacter sediminis]|uniref:SGNH/GDSL hydrolase family protein n=1 Tax=Rufibacter sediminis TaxID=2762756 RepID=A0ABR6VQ84_9BACT|nr:SGNH/GDSL hydrolase family protein [Rufibacter sediminis]MBC3539359.1 SGNH/GDSL hydrolase family protein [Rufibacter sediminis]
MHSFSDHSRRSFIKKAALGSVATLGIPQILTEAFAAEKPKTISFKKDSVLLFQGDSITDAGRKREDTGYNSSQVLGSGYAMLAAAELLHTHADKNLKIYNKGISGFKVYQVAERWNTDTLALKPDVLSILIGVNDFWHTLSFGYKGTLQTYQQDFRALLDRTKQALPELQLVVGEPFAVKGIKVVDEKWFPAFDAYRQTAREIAQQFNATFIPYQSVYEKAQKLAPGVYWTYDGVHPTLAGAQLMAQAWLKAVQR